MSKNRIVIKDNFFQKRTIFTYKGKYYMVSTVFLLDKMYETLIFISEKEDYLFCGTEIWGVKYFTEKEALKGHNEIMRDLKKGQTDYFYDAVAAYEKEK